MIPGTHFGLTKWETTPATAFSVPSKLKKKLPWSDPRQFFYTLYFSCSSLDSSAMKVLMSLNWR